MRQGLHVHRAQGDEWTLKGSTGYVNHATHVRVTVSDLLHCLDHQTCNENMQKESVLV